MDVFSSAAKKIYVTNNILQTYTYKHIHIYSLTYSFSITDSCPNLDINLSEKMSEVGINL